MRTPRFYQAQALVPGQSIALCDDAVQHIARALRMKSGDSIALFNGDGVEYSATLTHVAKREVQAQINEALNINRSSTLQVQIGQCISRGDRFDYAIQKSTELGMHSLTPLWSERCEVKLNAERSCKKRQQWQQLAISACEQSLRTTVPHIAAPTQLRDWIQQCDAEVKLVLHHHCAKPLSQFEPPQSVALLIGPEGGLTEEEVEAAIASGFSPVALGPRVLRTETAPVAAQAVLQYLWGDLS
ncbi:MAG: 16S rRNA (uracil(1498)-N(3))-methyltransferase [Pseudomonadales bacterium]